MVSVQQEKSMTKMHTISNCLKWLNSMPHFGLFKIEEMSLPRKNETKYLPGSLS